MKSLVRCLRVARISSRPLRWCMTGAARAVDLSQAVMLVASDASRGVAIRADRDPGGTDAARRAHGLHRQSPDRRQAGVALSRASVIAQRGRSGIPGRPDAVRGNVFAVTRSAR